VIRVADKKVAPTVAPNERADDSNSAHLAAPMPGVVTTVAVVEGQKVEAGDLVMTLEAMKMDTAIHAPHAGTVTRIAVAVHQQVDPKDLLAVIE
jgi:pyruvate carboxylase